MDAILSLIATAQVLLVIYWLFEGLTFHDRPRRRRCQQIPESQDPSHSASESANVRSTRGISAA